jgi:membrane protease YdiL (CAAX protease family)
MTLKRLVLILLTLVIVVVYGQILWKSREKPQFQTTLELYQTNIVLQASSLSTPDTGEPNFIPLKQAIIGSNPLEEAIEQYQQAQKSAETNLEKAKKQLAQLESKPVTTPTAQPQIPPVTNTSELEKQQELQQSVNQLQKLVTKINLRLGILYAKQGEQEKALEIWTQLLQQTSNTNPKLVKTAMVLQSLESNPPRLLPNVEQVIQSNLEGWFRYTALEKLYKLEQRREELANLKSTQQQAAEEALLKLGIIITIPGIIAFVGIGLLIFVFVQRLIQGKTSLLSQNADVAWSTPWDAETIVQVFVLGFFLMGLVMGIIASILFESVLSLLSIERSTNNVVIPALSSLWNYLLVAFATLSVLYYSIKPTLPLPDEWFRFQLKGKWFLWGLGGYCVAFPTVVVVSLINEQIWQGQGGSNPLLQLALESQDTVALTLFFLTAAIAAPIFEELLFRGFLLPSLTRYIPVWGAIFASSLLFAVAHLSLSEILPLSALGLVLGVVYTRSRNLLAPILLHSLWNSGTLLSLYILGSS